MQYLIRNTIWIFIIVIVQIPKETEEQYYSENDNNRRGYGYQEESMLGNFRQNGGQEGGNWPRRRMYQGMRSTTMYQQGVQEGENGDAPWRPSRPQWAGAGIRRGWAMRRPLRRRMPGWESGMVRDQVIETSSSPYTTVSAGEQNGNGKLEPCFNYDNRPLYCKPSFENLAQASKIQVC